MDIRDIVGGKKFIPVHHDLKVTLKPISENKREYV